MIEIKSNTCGSKHSFIQVFLHMYYMRFNSPGCNQVRGSFPLWWENLNSHGLQPVDMKNRLSGFGDIFAPHGNLAGNQG